MHRHPVDVIGAKDPSLIARNLPPERIIRKRGHHHHLMPAFPQVVAKPGVERRDSGQLRRIIDSPDDDAHVLTVISYRGVVVGKIALQSVTFLWPTRHLAARSRV